MRRMLSLMFVAALVACGSPRDDHVTLAFNVEGMHCDGCVAAITAEVKEVPGVQSVEVSLEKHRAVIVVDGPSRSQAVEGAITKLGYKVAPETVRSAP